MYTFPRVSTTNFKPNLPTGAQTIDGRISMANSYYPANIRRVQGDVTPFLDFVKRLLPEGRDAEILIAFMAACTRYLGVKFTWCPFIQGTKGNGKTTIAKILQYCISHDYTHWAKANELKEKYNSHLLGKILVVVDEMYSDDKAELQELLKELVTSDRVEIRAMYADKFMKDVCFNMLLISNHQNGVRVDANERRYAPLFCAQQEKADNARDGLTKPYFRELWSWLKADGFAIIYDYLLTVDIPEDLDPTKGATIAPETTSTERAALQSLGNIEQEIANAIEQQQDGFRGGWLSEHALDLLLARLGKDKFTPRTLRRSMIRALGYDPHPALADGVCAEPLPDGVRTRLYIRKGHAWAVAHLTPAQVRDGFVEHQKLAR
ncbi:MAG: primase-helicase family protein, partial [Chthoniobacterales bacterium]